ncbi:serine/threonine-protein phosphatase [Pseudothauera nasutitermitis]|uniref:Serine/threonine-protein phosphatase n=1 Tax=Pseudothauera nasutitermitis TaxID=2565930 RepID=A0A4S4AYL1_9RHOO|nr:PP2C family serine/threonine-protein phosphatase [Pseudothauera nasutitermitis]THF63722.1 serine/threonine-protein phosphatase [Pseudothauera nasutitermitis]
MQSFSPTIRWAGLSHVGRQRPRNEDVFHVLEEQACAVLADGMGGHRGGDVAARIAVEQACAWLQPRLADPAAMLAQRLCEAAEQANLAVLAAAERERGLIGMGATLLLAVLRPGRLIYASVGDSRLYRFRSGGLAQLTRDHTMLQDLVDGGMITAEQARLAPFRGMLTRALGVMPGVEADAGEVDLCTGDLLLLCSDGLTDMLDDDTIAGLLAEGDTLEEQAAALVQGANRAGGRDNITVVLARAD